MIGSTNISVIRNSTWYLSRFNTLLANICYARDISPKFRYQSGLLHLDLNSFKTFLKLKPAQYFASTETTKISNIMRTHPQSHIPTLFLIWLAVSVRNMDEVGSLALILVCAPWRAGKNTECKRAGFINFNLGATSRVMRKYGSCKRKLTTIQLVASNYTYRFIKSRIGKNWNKNQVQFISSSFSWARQQQLSLHRNWIRIIEMRA